MAGNRVVITFIGQDNLSKTIRKVSDELGDVAGATTKWGSILGAVAAVSAPAALAAVAVGFVGLGAIIGAQNEKVQKSFTQLKDHVVSELKDMAAPFTPVLLRVSDLFRRTFDSIGPQLRQAFATSAPYLERLAGGLADLVKNIMPGFLSALKDAKPVVDVLGKGLGEMGTGIGQFFAEIGKAGGPAAIVLQSVFDIVNGLLPILGRLIADAATGLAPVFKELKPIVLDVAAALGDVLGTAFKELGPAIGELLKKLQPVAHEALPFIAGVIKNTVIPALREFINWLTNNIDNIKIFAMDTVVHFLEAGKGVLSFVSLTLGAMEKVFAVLGLLPGEFGRNMRAAAVSTGQAKDGVDKFRGTVDLMHSKSVELRAQIIGQMEADRLKHTVEWFPTVKNVRIQFSTNYGSIGGTSLLAAAHGRAVGGTVNKGQTYLVGERGPEILTMGGSGSVTPNHKIASGSAGAGPVEITFAGNTDSVFASAFMKLVRSGQIQLARA